MPSLKHEYWPLKPKKLGLVFMLYHHLVVCILLLILCVLQWVCIYMLPSVGPAYLLSLWAGSSPSTRSWSELLVEQGITLSPFSIKYLYTQGLAYCLDPFSPCEHSGLYCLDGRRVDELSVVTWKSAKPLA